MHQLTPTCTLGVTTGQILSGCFLFVCFAHYSQLAVGCFVQKVECQKNAEFLLTFHAVRGKIVSEKGLRPTLKGKKKMKRVVNVDAIYRTKDVHKNLARFAKKFPEAADFCEFDNDCTIEQIKKSLPLTDKYWADGTVNNEWTYYFDIDFDQDGMYIWFIERA